MSDQEARDELAQTLREVYLTTPATRGGSIPKWLAVADAVIAAGYRKHPEPEWEYARRYSEMDGSFYCRTISEADVKARKPDGHRSDGSAYWNYVDVRRTVAGPWEPVS